MEPFDFSSTCGQSIGAYDCGNGIQPLVCLWIENPEFSMVDETIDKYGDYKGIHLTPLEARAVGERLIQIADYLDSQNG